MMQLPDRHPTISVGNLILRPWQDEDAEQIVVAFADPEMRDWLEHSVADDLAAKEWMAGWRERWQQDSGAGWAIVRMDDLRIVLGQVAFRALYLKDGVGECSYWVAPDHRGQGIAPKATRGLCEWAFTHLGLHRVELIHSVRNPRSCRVAVKAGFGPEGIERSLQPYPNGGRHDMHLHARVRPAQTRATPWDRALIDVASHGRLWSGASVLSLAAGMLGAKYPIAATLPIGMIAAVPILRLIVIREPRRRARRPLRDQETNLVA